MSFRKNGLIGLPDREHGFWSLTNSRCEVTKWEHIEGLKIRVLQVSLDIDTFSTLGAKAVLLCFLELFTALETETVASG